MKTVVWKYTLQTVDEQALFMPGGAKLLSVQVQNGVPCLWALVDPDAQASRVPLVTVGTGHRVDPETLGAFVGTYQLSDGALVFHVFEARQ